MLGRQHPRKSYKSAVIKADSSMKSGKGFLGVGRSIASSYTSELELLFPDGGSSSTPGSFSFTFSCAEPQTLFSPWLWGISSVLHSILHSKKASDPSSWKSLFASQYRPEGVWTASVSWRESVGLDPCLEGIIKDKYEDSDFLPFDGLTYIIKTMSQANMESNSQMNLSKKRR